MCRPPPRASVSADFSFATKEKSLLKMAEVFESPFSALLSRLFYELVTLKPAFLEEMALNFFPPPLKGNCQTSSKILNPNPGRVRNKRAMGLGPSKRDAERQVEEGGVWEQLVLCCPSSRSLR